MKNYINANFSRFFSSMRSGKYSASPIKLVGIRGANAGLSGNRFSVYDDLILVSIDGHVTQWPASVDPGWSLVVHPINPDGAAQLLPGLHLFQKHLMHAGTPRQHQCLGQAEDFHINRLYPDGTIKRVVYGDFGICIHSGGDGMDPRRFTAGCQVIQNPDGYFGEPTWSRFWGPICDGMTAHHISVVPYLLIDAKDAPPVA